MQKDALPLLNAQRFAKSHHLAVDGGDTVAWIHRAVGSAEQVTVPIVKGEKKFLIVESGVVAWFYHQKAVLTAVLSAGEIAHRHGVSVIPAKTGRARHEGVACDGVSGYGRGAFLDSAVDFRGQQQTVPVNHLWAIGPVGNLDGNGLILLLASQRGRRLAVVGPGFSSGEIG